MNCLERQLELVLFSNDVSACARLAVDEARSESDRSMCMHTLSKFFEWNVNSVPHRNDDQVALVQTTLVSQLVTGHRLAMKGRERVRPYLT